MAFFKVVFLLHSVGLVQLSSYVIGGANNFSRCNHTNIIKAYEHLLQRHIKESLNRDESNPEIKNVINCCPNPKGTQKRAALLACIHRFSGACVAARYPDVWTHTASLLQANCNGYVRPKEDNAWNSTITHKKSRTCKNQRRKIITNQECGNYTLQELQMMWKHYNQMIE